jgi:segregation and condensation protein A
MKGADGAAPSSAVAPHPPRRTRSGNPRPSPSPRVRGEGEGQRPVREQLVLDLDGYEGPIDLLLSLAREQKVDLAKISILALADQYLGFIAAQRPLRLEVAADYLVMAAWLAYLKSRLLLPQPREDDDPGVEEIAAALGHRLKLLEAMQTAGRRLMARDKLGQDFFLRGAPEGLATVPVPVWRLELYELLRAYGDGRRRRTAAILTIEPSAFYSMDDALIRFARFLGRVPDWRALVRFLPEEPRGDQLRRSALASTFAAALELARDGRIELRQDRAFGPIWLRSRAALRRAGEGISG